MVRSHINISNHKSSLFPAMPTGLWPALALHFLLKSGVSIINVSLILYVKHDLHFSNTLALSLVADALAFNYALQLLTGYIAGRFLSYRALLTLGITLSLIGLMTLTVPTVFCLYLGLSLTMTGLGIVYTCLYLLISQAFLDQPSLRQTGFIWDNIIENSSYFLTYSLAGWLQLTNQYSVLFKITAAIFAVTFVILYKFWDILKDQQTHLTALTAPQKKMRFNITLPSMLCLIPILFFLLKKPEVSSDIIIVLAFFILIFLALQARRLHGKAQRKFILFTILWLIYVFVCTIQFLTPLAITLFELHNVNRHLLGIHIPIGWIQSLSVILSVSLAPLFAYLLNFLRMKNHTLSTPTLFLYGLVYIGLSLLCLSLGIIFASTQGYISFYWLIANLIFSCIASLCLDPPALSMVGELTPRLLQGVMMGILSFSGAISAILSSLISIHIISHLHTTNPLSTNPYYSHTFSTLGYSAIALAFIMLLCQPVFRRLQSQ